MNPRQVNRKRSAAGLQGERRRQQVLDMRMNHKSYAEIAAALGVSKTRVSQLLNDALDREMQETNEKANKVRHMELRRLDAVAVDLFAKAKKGDLGSVDRLLKVMERRARLLGLDAPERVSIEDPLPKVNLEDLSEQELEILEAAARINERLHTEAEEIVKSAAGPPATRRRPERRVQQDEDHAPQEEQRVEPTSTRRARRSVTTSAEVKSAKRRQATGAKAS